MENNNMMYRFILVKIILSIYYQCKFTYETYSISVSNLIHSILNV